MELKSLLILIALLVSLSSSSSISNCVFESQTSVSSTGGRNLLQVKKKCEVNFEYMNYTVMTTRCKGPTFPAKECCAAFKEFACPYAKQINDLTTDCANTMFSYMNIYGKYPTGLFANECKETKDGLVCPHPHHSSPNLTADSNAPSLISVLASVLLVFLVLG